MNGASPASQGGRVRAGGLPIRNRLAGIDEVDLAELALKVSTADTNYRAALQTVGTISPQSLLAFVR